MVRSFKAFCFLIEVCSYERQNELKRCEISYLLKILLWCSVSSLLVFILKRNETQTSVDFILLVLAEMTFQTGMRFSCEKKITRSERNKHRLVATHIAFNAHMRLNLTAVI